MSGTYAASWEIFKDGKFDPIVRAELQGLLLEEWSMIDLEAALQAAISESMIGACAPGIEARSEDVFAWIGESKFGLSTWPLLSIWIEIIGEKDPRMLLRHYDELPADPIPVERTAGEFLPDHSSDSFLGGQKSWRDAGFVKQTLRTLGGPVVPFAETSPPREKALLAVVRQAHRESTASTLATEMMARVFTLTEGAENQTRRESVVLALSAYDAETLESRLRTGGDPLVRQLYIDAYADKFRQVEPLQRTEEAAKIPEELREEVLQHLRSSSR